MWFFVTRSHFPSYAAGVVISIVVVAWSFYPGYASQLCVIWNLHGKKGMVLTRVHMNNLCGKLRRPACVDCKTILMFGYGESCHFIIGIYCNWQDLLYGQHAHTFQLFGHLFRNRNVSFCLNRGIYSIVWLCPMGRNGIHLRLFQSCTWFYLHYLHPNGFLCFVILNVYTFDR